MKVLRETSKSERLKCYHEEEALWMQQSAFCLTTAFSRYITFHYPRIETSKAILERVQDDVLCGEIQTLYAPKGILKWRMLTVYWLLAQNRYTTNKE